MAYSHECLSPYTRDGSGGETRTFTLQKRFAQRLRGVLSRINARIRDAIQDGLFDFDDEALVDDPPDEIFEFETDERRIRGLLRWLRSQLDNDFLEVVGPDRNQFIRAAYAAGLRNAQNQLAGLDVSFERRDADDLLSVPIHKSALQTLFTRTFENLQSVRDDVAQGVRDELVTGFTEGKGPNEIARNISGRINSIGKHRSTMIARSEVINAHSEATLNRVEELNRDAENDISVGHGEWDAAMGSPRTCPFCRAVNGVSLTPSEMATTTVQFRGDVYRLKPPAHVNGRCNISITVGGEITEPLEDRLPAEVTLLT